MAIDLVDKACASTRMQLETLPDSIYTLERRYQLLATEAQMLSKEPHSQQYLIQIGKYL